jgi:hypothetical protein
VVISVLERPDLSGMGDSSDYDQREVAYQWLMGDPAHRAIIAPSELDAVLDMYHARDEYPEQNWTRDQFLSEGQTVIPGVETRFVAFRTYFFM